MALVVNGERIKDSEVRQEADRMRPRYEEVFADSDPAEREAQLMDWSRENVVERVLLRQEAKQNGPEVPAKDVDEALGKLKEQYEDPEQLYKDLEVENEQDLKDKIELQMKVERKLNEVYESLGEPSKEDIKRYYDEDKENFRTPEQLRVAHIVKYVNWQTDEQTALEAIHLALAEIRAGSPFEAVVDKHTDCGDAGGDLGYVVRGQMVEEFEDVVFNLGVGEVSEVFRSRFGFHIAKLYDRRPSGIAELKDVRSEIIEQLKEQMREKALDDYLDGLRAGASIEQT